MTSNAPLIFKHSPYEKTPTEFPSSSQSKQTPSAPISLTLNDLARKISEIERSLQNHHTSSVLSLSQQIHTLEKENQELKHLVSTTFEKIISSTTTLYNRIDHLANTISNQQVITLDRLNHLETLLNDLKQKNQESFRKKATKDISLQHQIEQIQSYTKEQLNDIRSSLGTLRSQNLNKEETLKEKFAQISKRCEKLDTSIKGLEQSQKAQYTKSEEDKRSEVSRIELLEQRIESTDTTINKSIQDIHEFLVKLEGKVLPKNLPPKETTEQPKSTCLQPLVAEEPVKTSIKTEEKTLPGNQTNGTTLAKTKKNPGKNNPPTKETKPRPSKEEEDDRILQEHQNQTLPPKSYLEAPKKQSTITIQNSTINSRGEISAMSEESCCRISNQSFANHFSEGLQTIANQINKKLPLNILKLSMEKFMNGRDPEYWPFVYDWTTDMQTLKAAAAIRIDIIAFHVENPQTTYVEWLHSRGFYLKFIRKSDSKEISLKLPQKA